MVNKSNLFVGGIPYSTTEDQLKEHFSQAGEIVSVKIIVDRFTNRSKGFGFVEMASEEAAQKAIELLNGQDLGGRKIRVDVAKPRKSRE